MMTSKFTTQSQTLSRPSTTYRHIQRPSKFVNLEPEPEPTKLEEIEDAIFAARCWLAVLAISASIGLGVVLLAILFLLSNRPQQVETLSIPVPPGVVEEGE